MKNYMLVIIICLSGIHSFAQYREIETKEQEKPKSGGFKKDHLFTGGNLNLGFGSGYTVLGIAPYFGYSINRYVDVAVSPSISYTSQRDVYIPNDKLRQTIYGPGTFVRLFPVRFLFAQAQYEFNLIREKYLPNNPGYLNERTKYDAHSFLIGGGYSGGKSEDSDNFFYISVMWDIANSPNSPYKTLVAGRQRAIPVIRAGYNIALFQ